MSINRNLLPVTTKQLVLVAPSGTGTGFITALPVVLATDAKATVQAGVTACADGGTVLIYPGTYTEGVLASTAMNLIGTNRDACIIKSDAVNERAFSPSGGSGHEVENLTFQSAAVAETYTLGTTAATGSANFVARHVTINHTALAATRAFVSFAGSLNTLLDDAYITSTTGDANGVYLAGDYGVVSNSTIVCTTSADTSAATSAIYNVGKMNRVINTNMTVSSNHAGSEGVVGIIHEGYGEFLVEGCIINVLEDHAGSDADAIGVLANTAASPLIIKDSTLVVDVDGTGNSYGVKVTGPQKVLLINCTIVTTKNSGTAYPIHVATGCSITCVNCNYDRASSVVVGTGTIIDIMDDNGRVDVATANGAALTTPADIVNEWETQSQAAPAGFQVNVMQWGSDAQTVADLKDFADTGYNPSTHKVAGVVLTDTVTTLTGHTAQTGDSYAVVTHADYGNAQLVRSTTPAYTLDVSSTGEAGLDFANIKNATGATTLTNITVPTVTSVTNEVSADMIKLKSNGDAATDLADLAQFLIANEDENLTHVADGSVIANVMAINGVISSFVNSTDCLQAIRDKLPTNLEDLSITDTTGLVKATNSAGDAIPSTTAFEARTLPSADYVVVGDTIAGVTTVGSVTGSVGSCASVTVTAMADIDFTTTQKAYGAAWVTATGFSTHNPADVVTAMETNGSKLDHLWEMTEDDGGTRRLTGNALEESPASGLTEQQALDLADIKEQTDKFDNMIDEDSAGNYFTTEALINAPDTGGGATPQEIWEYTTRILTAGTNLNFAPPNEYDTEMARITADVATEAKQDIIDANVDSIKEQTDKLDNMIDEQSGVNAFTTEALANVVATATVDSSDLAEAMLAITGVTVGGTWTWEKVMKIAVAWSAGNWRRKADDPTVQELLDAEDGSTVILEQSLTRAPAAGDNYRDITVKI